MRTQKLVGLLIAFAIFFPQQSHATPLHINFSNVPGASISFGGDGTFSFPNLLGGSDFQISAQSGFTGPPSLVGLRGNLAGTFAIGAIQTIGGLSIAPVTTVSPGLFSISDGGSGLFSGSLSWFNIRQYGTGDLLNTAGNINLTNFTYNGTNQNLLELAASPNGVVTLSFQFVPAVSLAQLKSTSRTASYSGALTSTLVQAPEFSTLPLMGIGLLLLAVAQRRFPFTPAHEESGNHSSRGRI